MLHLNQRIPNQFLIREKIQLSPFRQALFSNFITYFLEEDELIKKKKITDDLLKF